MRFSRWLLTFMTVASGRVESATSLCRRVKLGGNRGRDIWLLALPSRLCIAAATPGISQVAGALYRHLMLSCSYKTPTSFNGPPCCVIQGTPPPEVFSTPPTVAESTQQLTGRWMQSVAARNAGTAVLFQPNGGSEGHEHGHCRMATTLAITAAQPTGGSIHKGALLLPACG